MKQAFGAVALFAAVVLAVVGILTIGIMILWEPTAQLLEDPPPPASRLAYLPAVPNTSGTWVDVLKTNSACIYIVRWAEGVTVTSQPLTEGGCR